MNDANKTNNFLNAIQKYADQQKQDMQNEIEKFKEEEIKKAEKEGLHAAYELIHNEMETQKSIITRDLAKREKQGKDELFVKRSHMMRNIFEKATEKLTEYTSTEAYKTKLFEQVKEIAKIFGNKSCVIYLNEKDLRFSKELQDCFQGETTVEALSEITIGGVKVFCQQDAIIADETLDSKLEDQKQWFIENSALKVM